MKKAERVKQKAELLKALEWWTSQRAEAIKHGDQEAQTEAEAGRINTLKALEELNRKR